MSLQRTMRKIKRKTRRLRRNVSSLFYRMQERGSSYEEMGSGYRRRRRRPLDNIHVYVVFIAVVTVVCLLAVQLAPGSRFRNWYHDLVHKPVVNKGMQYTEREGESVNKGSFLTYYRYNTFGETDPEEVDTSAPMIAFTFDDGPNPDHTKRILDTLTANYSHATFFVVGPNAESYPDTLKAISLAGCEIGNHTYNHKDLTSISSDEVEEQVDKVNRAVKAVIGEETTVIRPPYGAFNDSVMSQLQEPVILWDLDTEDWDSRNAQKVVEKVLGNVKDGDIVLMHDIYDSTAEAVEILVPKLKEQGFQIVSVSELARYKGKQLELGKAYGEIEGDYQGDTQE